MFDRPNQGFCVDAECRGNPGISRFQLYDLDSQKIVIISDKFYATNNIAEFLGLVNALSYCMKYRIDTLYTDSKTALSWLKKKRVNSSMKNDIDTKSTWERVSNAISYLNKLKYNDHYKTYTNQDGAYVTVCKWITSEWGEIPADFGNKI